MQKTTLFTIFFSILIVVVLAEFLTSTDLQTGLASVVHSDASAISTPMTTQGSDVSTTAPAGETSPFLQDSTDTPPATTPADTLSPVPVVPAPEKSEVASFLSTTGYKIEKVTDAQLVSMGFQDMRLERVSADGLLFQLLDLGDVVNLSKVRFHLTDGKNVYGVVNEFLLGSDFSAKGLYQNLRKKALVYEPDVKVNETNSFGTSSFFLNDNKRLGTAFLTVLSGNRIFAFSYPKASHEFFKKLIQLLVT